MDGFSVISERNNGHRVFRLKGDLDLATAAILESALDGIGGPIIFDCAELEFVDSSGLRIFATAAGNGGATLRNVSDALRRVLEITRLDGLCEN
jgi:anti-anti-sigma factor